MSCTKEQKQKIWTLAVEATRAQDKSLLNQAQALDEVLGCLTDFEHGIFYWGIYSKWEKLGFSKTMNKKAQKFSFSKPCTWTMSFDHLLVPLITWKKGLNNPHLVGRARSVQFQFDLEGEWDNKSLHEKLYSEVNKLMLSIQREVNNNSNGWLTMYYVLTYDQLFYEGNGTYYVSVTVDVEDQVLKSLKSL